MNYGFVSGARFRPFSYQEMVAPLQQATEAQQQIEDAYGELGAQSDLMASIANEQANPEAYKMYRGYADELASQAENLAKSGLTPGSRNALANMRRRFSSEIVPIQTAQTKREQLTKEQREAMMRDPSLMFDIDYRNASIDDLMKNPNATYSSVSGTDLTKRAAQMAANFAKTLQQSPQYESILGGQYFQQMQQMGYTPDQIMQTVLNDANAPKELKQIANTVYEQAGLNKYSPEVQTRGRQFINAGLYEAIGTQKYDVVNNKGYMTAAESARLGMERERLNMAKEQQAWAREKWQEDRLGVEMPDGSRVKDIGAGRVRVTKPDGTWEIVAAPTNSTKPTKPTKSSLFSMIEYTGGGFNSPGWSDRFSEPDAKIVQFNSLGPKAKQKLIEDLAKYELTPEDVDIYEDMDIMSKNHYRIVRKGTGVSGMAPSQTEAAVAPVQPAQQPQGVSFDPNSGL